MRYTLKNMNGMYQLSIPTDSEYGTICFNWDDSDNYINFKLSLDTKGIDVFVDLLIKDPNTAYTIFCNG